MFLLPRARACLASVVLLAACSGRQAAAPARGLDAARGPHDRAGATDDGRPEPFEPGAGSGDVVAPYVRPERSSRLAVPLPTGRAREIWTAPLEARNDPAFLLAAGARIVVQGRSGGAANGSVFVVFDRKGRRVAAGTYEGTGLRLVPSEGTFHAVGGASTWWLADGKSAPDDLERDPPPENGMDARRAPVHDHAIVFAQGGVIRLRDDRGSRDVAEGRFDALDASIDDDGILHALVRQDRDLALWSAPLGGGSMGRVRLGPYRRDRVAVPPIAGKTVRVIVLDDRIVAIGQDGKTLWERRGALTGGATITSDDHLLAASDARVLAVDPRGRVTELVTAPREVFLTPPILVSRGAAPAPVLLVASGTALHAYAFE